MKQFEKIIFYLIIFFLPTQLGKHFWPDFAIIAGLRIDYLSPTVYVTDILLFLLVVCCTIPLLLSEKNRRDILKKIHAISRPSLCTVIAIVLFLISNIVLSERMFNGAYVLLKLLECVFVFYYCSHRLTNWQTLKPVLLVLSLGIGGESLLAIVQFILQGSVGGMLWFVGERTFTGQTPGIANASIDGQLLLRPYATFSHPNVLAGYLVTIMTLLFFCWDKFSQKREHWLIGSSLLLGTCALLLTLSRVAILVWIIILVSVSLYLLLRRHRNSFKRKVMILCFLLLTILGVALSPVAHRLISTSLTEESVTQRSLLLTLSGHMLLTHPVFGVGLGNFLPTVVNQQQPLTTHSILQPVHSIFFLIAAETGLTGLLIFIWFLGKTYARIRNCFPLLALLMLTLVLGLFDHYWLTIQQGQFLFAFILGVCWARPLCVPK